MLLEVVGQSSVILKPADEDTEAMDYRKCTAWKPNKPIQMDKKWFLIWLIRADPIYVKPQNSATPTPQTFSHKIFDKAFQ